MSPLKIQTIQDKLFRLNENIQFMEDILKQSDEEIIKDAPNYNGLEHMLQLSIQIVLDIGTHILAEEFHENPKVYQDTIVLLAKHGIIDEKFSVEQTEMVKFRNKIVHDYDNVDKQKVISYARVAPAIFKVFGKAYTTFLQK